MATEQEGVSLREYVDLRFDMLERAALLAYANIERAVIKADSATEKRFDGVNEFRAALADNSRNFLPRPEYETAHRALVEKIDALAQRVTERDSKARGVRLGWGLFAGILGVIISVLTTLVMIVHVRSM